MAMAWEALLASGTYSHRNSITVWLLGQPKELREQFAESILEKLIHDVSQSKQSSGKTCIELCGLVDHCAKSKDVQLRQWALSEPVATRLLDFYLEWNEHDPHRSMRLVLEVLEKSLGARSRPEVASAVKGNTLDTLVSIIARKSTRPLAKSSLEALSFLLRKQAVSLDDVASKYKELEPSLADSTELALWKSFTFELFSWMDLHYISPIIGKILVFLFKSLRHQGKTRRQTEEFQFSAQTWQEWLQEGLTANPYILEDVKTYFLRALFKSDKEISLELLQHLNDTLGPLSAVGDEATDMPLLLQLTVLELGKRYGLVDEPVESPNDPEAGKPPITPDRGMLERMLRHPTHSVRSSAFSLLVSSQSTSKPISVLALGLLMRHLPAFYGDSNPKLRNDMLSYSKALVRRVKNVIAVAKRGLGSVENGIKHENSARQGAMVGNKGVDGLSSGKKFGPEGALKDDAEAKTVLERHEAFLKWYMCFLRDELVPTASYQRHVTAVRAILTAIEVEKSAGIQESAIDLALVETIASDSTWMRLIFDLIMDSFNDVRETAASLLALFPRKFIIASRVFDGRTLTLEDLLAKFCIKAQNLASRTGRADYGDGAARSAGLQCSWAGTKELQIVLISKALDRLENRVAQAKQNLGYAAVESPVHADFASVSYMWQILPTSGYSEKQLKSLRTIQERMYDYSRRSWDTVRHVLCDDSPEGHLPEELEEIEGLDTKDLLSYSFRAIHESSNLLRLIVSALRFKQRPGLLLPSLKLFTKIGNLTFDQLANLRHCGAFSTVAHTFATCCQMTQKLDTAFPQALNPQGLLCEWFSMTLNCIMTQASTTRRSAGIPALVTGILAANSNSPSFGEVVQALKEIAEKPARVTETDGSNLPQVHALNSLKDVFRSSLLSKYADSYLAPTLQLAAGSLRSEVWAIRNCGLLLFRSLSDALFGRGSKADVEEGWDGHTLRLSYDKYPSLPGILLGLLASAEMPESGNRLASAAEAVFPALDIIRRAGPPEEYRAELRKYVEKYLGSHIWHVREIAAKTLCAFLIRSDWLAEMEGLIRLAGNRTNWLHGTLLALRFVLEKKMELGGGNLQDDAIRLQPVLATLVERSQPFQSCEEIRAAYVEVVTLTRIISQEQTERELRAPDSLGSRTASSALLLLHEAIGVVHRSAASNNVGDLQESILHWLDTDINTACRALESVPKYWRDSEGSTISKLCLLYVEVCRCAPASDAQARALENLADLMDLCLSTQGAEKSLEEGALTKLWGVLSQGDISPSLSHAILRVSGPVMATLILRSPPSHGSDETAVLLREWGSMTLDALDVHKTFETRFAATKALQSFVAGLTHQKDYYKTYPFCLPLFSALYAALNDDDDEIRDCAARASALLFETDTPVAPYAAADALVSWLAEHLADEPAFHLFVACRMVEDPASAASDFTSNMGQNRSVVTPAVVLINRALQFDDALFAVEEQNLFVDELREARRWRNVFVTKHGRKTSAAKALHAWTAPGLERLLELVEGDGAREDGPCGWASDQHVFAAFARVLLCATALVEVGVGVDEIVGTLNRFRNAAERKGLHGALLMMAVVEA